MNFLLRAVRALPETYALNFSQILHMLVLAALVPLYIGVEEYGIFAAIIAVPGLIQSAFEAFSVAILVRYGRRDMLDTPIRFFLVPTSLFVMIGFFYFLDPMIALYSTALMLSLFWRSYAFAIAISTKKFTRKIVESEAIILLIYVMIFALCAGFGIKDRTLPMLMITAASLVSGFYLLSACEKVAHLSLRRTGTDKPKLPLGVAAGAASARMFEDGLLTLSPLVLVLTASPAVAGQFRVFVSLVKAAYKLFPYRYEIALRDVSNGRLGIRPLAIASISFSVSSMIFALLIFVLLPVDGYLWLLLLVGSAGAAVSSLSLYPAASSADRRMPIVCLVTLIVMFLLASYYGVAGFVAGFIMTSYLVLAFSLFALKRATRLEATK